MTVPFLTAIWTLRPEFEIVRTAYFVSFPEKRDFAWVGIWRIIGSEIGCVILVLGGPKLEDRGVWIGSGALRVCDYDLVPLAERR
jgi:hypothetical protein